MTDFPHRSANQHVPIRTHLADSAGTFLHLLVLLWQCWWSSGERSIEAELQSGERVSLAQGFRLDGTTFVVLRDDGTHRRIPASTILRIADRGNYGYA